MEITNCRSCGCLFNVFNKERVCPVCRQKLEDKFQQVKKFLEENPGAVLERVSKETEVSIKQLQQWIKEERLVLSEGCLDGVACERCGKLLQTGRYCQECKGRITNTLRSAMNTPKKESNRRTFDGIDRDKMRYIK